jgi:peptidoglycan/xylan/chitin deacetylase (PgdA/CDA1 family)
MHDLSAGKHALLAAWYYGTLAYRWWANHRAARHGRMPVMVLFYHRVADEKPNAWTMPTAMFAEQMAWLRRHCEVVSLAEAQRRVREGYNDRPAVAVTFDDGYADNCRAALPLLVEQGIPCTYFVCTRHVLEGVPFPHDVALGRPLRPNSIDELRELAEQGIEIGAHTRTHADLGKLDADAVLYDEVVAAGEDLAAALGRPIRYFAFPYGMPANLNMAAFRLLREAGYEGACSAYGAYNVPGTEAFHVRRIHADSDMLRFKNWLTVDPRKARTRDPIADHRMVPLPRPAGACQP